MLDKKKIISIISKSLKTKVNINSNVDNTEKWDSIGHLQILASLDKLSKGKISKISEIAGANSTKSILKILKKKKIIK